MTTNVARIVVIERPARDDVNSEKRRLAIRDIDETLSQIPELITWHEKKISELEDIIDALKERRRKIIARLIHD